MRYVLFYGLRGLCVGHVINLIDFVVRRLAESVSISGADIDFWMMLMMSKLYDVGLSRFSPVESSVLILSKSFPPILR